MYVFRRQEAVDLLLGLRRLPVDADGNIANAPLKEPLDLDRWTSATTAGAETEAAAVSTANALGSDQEESDTYAASGTPLVMAGLTRDTAGRSESAVDVAGRSSGGGGGSGGRYRCSAEGKSVSIRQREEKPRLQRRRSGGHVEGGMRGDHRGGGATEEAVMTGGGDVTGKSAVQRVTGAALAELRMAGPYSTLALAVRCLVIGAVLLWS